jgi:hypothetical protein
MYQEAYNWLEWGKRNAGRRSYSIDTTCNIGHLLIFLCLSGQRRNKGYKYGKRVFMMGERRMEKVHA